MVYTEHVSTLPAYLIPQSCGRLFLVLFFIAAIHTAIVNIITGFCNNFPNVFDR